MPPPRPSASGPAAGERIPLDLKIAFGAPLCAISLWLLSTAGTGDGPAARS